MAAKAGGMGFFVPPQTDSEFSFEKLEPALMVISAAIGEYIRKGDGDGLKNILVHLALVQALAFEQLEAAGLDTSTLKKNIEKSVATYLKNR